MVLAGQVSVVTLVLPARFLVFVRARGVVMTDSRSTFRRKIHFDVMCEFPLLVLFCKENLCYLR